MYAPSFDSCLDPRLGMPETLDEVLLNRTSFTQAYVEQQSKLNEQKFLALSRNFELFKTHMEQAQLLRNNEIEARITNIEGKVEKCIKQISGILDRLVDCEGLSNVKTLLQPVGMRNFCMHRHRLIFPKRLSKVLQMSLHLLL